MENQYSNGPNRTLLLLILTFVVWAVFFLDTITSTVAIWYRLETFTHCFLILPICIYLIYRRWPELKGVKIRPAPLVICLLLGAQVLWLFGRLAHVLVVEQFFAFLTLPLITWSIFGSAFIRKVWFVCCFWMFSIPFGEFLVPQLQNLTADITVMALQLTRIPVYREGLYIAIPGGLFEVAVACSGIRYLIASFTLGTLFAYLNYQSVHKRLVFVLFSLFLPLLANGLRAYGIVMIAHLSDMKYATGVDHLIYGWLFFGVVIFIIFSIGSIWADPEARIEVQKKLPTYSKKNITMALITSVALLATARFYTEAMGSPPGIDWIEVNLPQGNVTESSWLPRFHSATKEHKSTVEGVEVYLAFYGHNAQGSELINTTNLVYNEDTWSLVEAHEFDHHRQLRIVNTAGVHRTLLYTYLTPDITSSSPLKVKFWQAINAFLGNPQPGAFVAVSAILTDQDSDNSKANLVLRELLEKGYHGLITHD